MEAAVLACATKPLPESGMPSVIPPGGNMRSRAILTFVVRPLRRPTRSGDATHDSALLARQIPSHAGSQYRLVVIFSRRDNSACAARKLRHDASRAACSFRSRRRMSSSVKGERGPRAALGQHGYSVPEIDRPVRWTLPQVSPWALPPDKPWIRKSAMKSRAESGLLADG